MARRYFRFRWGIDYQHGNAGEWCDGALPSTLALATSPMHGDLIVFAPGSCGADSTTGHIAVVDTVDMAASKVTIVEQNQAGRRTSQQSCAKCYLHAVENDGTVGGSSSGGSSSAGSSSSGSSSSGSYSGGRSGSEPVVGGAPAGAGSASGGTASGGAAGSSSGLGLAGAAGASGPAPGSGGFASIAGSSSRAGSTSATSHAAAADDAGCHVGRVAESNGAPPTTSWLVGLVLLFSLRHRPRRVVNRCAVGPRPRARR